MSDKEQIEFKNYYMVIFSINYFFQGLNQSLFAVIIPIYLIQFVGVINIDALAFLATVISIPWIFKIIYGVLGDKYGSKRFGRRRIWITSMVIFSGIMWTWLGIPGLFTKENAIFVFMIFGLLISLGTTFADTIIDGFILDICPKEKLGRTSGLCWGFRSVGAIAGGPAFALLVAMGSLDVPSLFILIGILVIATALLTVLVKEPKEFPEVIVTFHLKQMFNNKRDLKTYIFSFFSAMVDTVVVLIISIYILIQMGIISSEGVSLSLPAGDLNVYLYNGYITMIISSGIIGGAVIGGQIADRITRKLSVYLAYILTTIAFLLMLITTQWPILIIFSVIVGIASGWRHSSYAAVVTEISKLHPEMDSTYYSLCNAFSNFGAILGLAITGIILRLTESYLVVFLFCAIISNIGLIGFILLNPADYEHKKINNK